jgi:hypothetical protein
MQRPCRWEVGWAETVELAAGRLRYAVRSVPCGLACHLGWFYLTTTTTTKHQHTQNLLQR